MTNNKCDKCGGTMVVERSREGMKIYASSRCINCGAVREMPELDQRAENMTRPSCRGYFRYVAVPEGASAKEVCEATQEFLNQLIEEGIPYGDIQARVLYSTHYNEIGIVIADAATGKNDADTNRVLLSRFEKSRKIALGMEKGEAVAVGE